MVKIFFIMPKYIFLLLTFPLCSIFAKSSVWRVSKEDQSFYIGGTCHILRSSDYPLPVEFEYAYLNSETLIFEIDPLTTSSDRFTTQLLRATSYHDNRSLKKVLTRKNFNALKEKCEQNGLSIKVLQKTKPSMVIMMLLVKELSEIDAIEEGLDVYFQKRALSDRKKILSLETAEFQIGLLASMDEDIENKMVAHGLKDIENLKIHFDNLVNTWREGDLRSIDDLFVKRVREYPELYKRLISSRNRDWIKRIEAFSNTQESKFFLVGIAHLAGEEGLISLLQKKGYTIEQVGSRFW